MWQIGEFTVYYIQNYVSDHTLCIWELLGRKIFLNLVSSYQVHQKFRYSPNHNFDWIQYRKNPIFRGSRPCQNSLFAGEGPRCSSDCCFQNHRQMGDSYRLFQSLENLFLVINSKICAINKKKCAHNNWSNFETIATRLRRSDQRRYNHNYCLLTDPFSSAFVGFILDFPSSSLNFVICRKFKSQFFSPPDFIVRNFGAAKFFDKIPIVVFVLVDSKEIVGAKNTSWKCLKK